MIISPNRWILTNLKIAIARATEHTRLKKENEYLKERLGEKFDRQNMIGQSPAMVKLLDTVSQVAATEATILITGESGTGKEMIANAIHYNSSAQRCAVYQNQLRGAYRNASGIRIIRP